MIWKVPIKSYSRGPCSNSCEAHRKGLLQGTKYTLYKTQIQHHVGTIADLSQGRKAHWTKDIY